MRYRLEIINFLKGFSIFTIVLMHLVQSYPVSNLLMKASSLGGAGVHVFILCSGFGLYLSYLNKPLSYPLFLKRRFLKVYLPYIIIITISALLPFYNSSPDKWMEFLSHIFLFKMFVEEWECSYGVQFWFVSTIIQFYLLWPLILRIFKWGGVSLTLFISLTWSTCIALTGLSNDRIWNSFFLQYLWEFVLGMQLAVYYKNNPEHFFIPSLKILIPISFVGLILTGVTGIQGGIWKAYNDIPSLIGYMGIALILYKSGIPFLNKLLLYTNKVSYEWYLVHILVFACSNHFLDMCYHVPPILRAITAFLMSYLIAIVYHKLLKILNVV